MVRLRNIVIAFVLMFAAEGAAHACSEISRCTVAGGYYRILLPEGGTRARSLLVFFHGFRMSAEEVVSDPDFIAFVKRSNTVLVVPNGIDGGWSHVGSPRSERDEIAFVARVLDDAQARFPVPRDRIWSAGFSQGAAMMWDVACYLGDRFKAFAPIAGGWWRPQPTTCPKGPVHLRHVHGLTDRQVPIEGRSIRERFHQGNVRDGLATWRQINGCAASPDQVRAESNLTCEIWSGCSGGKNIQFCTHPGGHDLDPRWLDQALDWLDRLP